MLPTSDMAEDCDLLLKDSDVATEEPALEWAGVGAEAATGFTTGARARGISCDTFAAGLRAAALLYGTGIAADLADEAENLEEPLGCDGRTYEGVGLTGLAAEVAAEADGTCDDSGGISTSSTARAGYFLPMKSNSEVDLLMGASCKK